MTVAGFIADRRTGHGVTHTVAKIMAELGLEASKPPRLRRSLTRQSGRKAARDPVHHHFDAVVPNALRVGGMTGIDTGEGNLCLATVIDLFSRRLLDCARGVHHDAALVGALPEMAASTRGGRRTG